MVERYQHETVDPKSALQNCPAMTTMLYVVCGKDKVKFDEAMRLVDLFVKKDRELREEEHLVELDQ